MAAGHPLFRVLWLGPLHASPRPPAPAGPARRKKTKTAKPNSHHQTATTRRILLHILRILASSLPPVPSPSLLHPPPLTPIMDAYSFDPFASAVDVEGLSSDEDLPSCSSNASSADEQPPSGHSDAAALPSCSDPSSSSSGTSSSGYKTTPPTSPTSGSGTSSSDVSYRPALFREKVALGLPIAHKPATIAAQLGFSSVTDHRFRIGLRRQHELRASDAVFAQTGEAPLITARWRAWRLEFLAPCGIRRVNLLTEVRRPRAIANKAPTTTAASSASDLITVYRCLAAVVNLPEMLINMFFTHFEHTDCTLMALVADGVGEAAPGCPGRGKAWGLYLKPLTTISPQSPRWLIPILTMLGPDKPHTLHPLFEELKFEEMITDIAKVRYGSAPSTLIVLIAFADYPGACAFTSLPTPARQFPSTPGRVPSWNFPICWLCGIAPLELYNHRLGARWRHAPPSVSEGRTAQIRSMIGIPLWLIFYELVHAINVATQALLADIGAFYASVNRGVVHPITAYVHALFPAHMWDPYLNQPASRSKDRKSRKPVCAVDPDILWGWLVDEKKQRVWCHLLEQYPVPWDFSDVDPAYVHDNGPWALWSFHLRFVDSAIFGDSSVALRAGTRTEDLWRCMLPLFRPIPADVRVALPPAQAPTFFNPTVAYGPASHTTFCSTPRFIDAVDEAYPKWRDAGITFAKFTAGIFLEHGMKRIRSDITDFAIATRAKRNRALEVLTRGVERFTLRTVLDDFDPPLAPTSAHNRAYKDVPLSRRVHPACTRRAPEEVQHVCAGVRAGAAHGPPVACAGAGGAAAGAGASGS